MTILLKWLLVLLVIVLALMWIKTAQGTRSRGNAADENPGQARQHRRPRRVAAPAPMVSCAHCGLNLPRDEAVPGDKSSGDYFCSQAHRREHARRDA